jgi:crotonobetainyl-CoA:carnitine CoA-transferase CaiB-like acyl-CoA transferase
MIASARHPAAGVIRYTGSPIKLSGQPARPDTPPPTLGEHTDLILTRELGLTDDEVKDLKERRVV